MEQISIAHAGVSAARNAGLRHASAEWVNFCDFDDTYSNVYALRDVISLLPAPQYDMLWTKLITEDLIDNGLGIFVTPKKSTFVFIHGKFYRRKWLIENDVFFDESLEFNEDSHFNAVILALLDYHRIGEVKTMYPPYVWCRRPESVTTTEGVTDRATYGHFRRNLKICDLYCKRMPDERTSDMIVRTVYDTYFMCNSTHVSDGMRDRIQKEFDDFFKGCRKYFRRPDNETLAQIESISKAELMEKDRVIPSGYETVKEWAFKERR